jgi:hypothetical protein
MTWHAFSSFFRMGSSFLLVHEAVPRVVSSVRRHVTCAQQELGRLALAIPIVRSSSLVLFFVVVAVAGGPAVRARLVKF